MTRRGATHGAALMVVLSAAVTLSAVASAAKVQTLQLGATFTVTGKTGSRPGETRRAIGLVVVRGKWESGVSYVMTTIHTDTHGNYRVAIKPSRRGLLTIRITPPDKHTVSYLLRVA
jgi:hypothetical protein